MFVSVVGFFVGFFGCSKKIISAWSKQRMGEKKMV